VKGTVTAAATAATVPRSGCGGHTYCDWPGGLSRGEEEDGGGKKKCCFLDGSGAAPLAVFSISGHNDSRTWGASLPLVAGLSSPVTSALPQSPIHGISNGEIWEKVELCHCYCHLRSSSHNHYAIAAAVA